MHTQCYQDHPYRSSLDILSTNTQHQTGFLDSSLEYGLLILCSSFCFPFRCLDYLSLLFFTGWAVLPPPSAYTLCRMGGITALPSLSNILPLLSNPIQPTHHVICLWAHSQDFPRLFRFDITHHVQQLLEGPLVHFIHDVMVTIYITISFSFRCREVILNHIAFFITKLL